MQHIKPHNMHGHSKDLIILKLCLSILYLYQNWEVSALLEDKISGILANGMLSENFPTKVVLLMLWALIILQKKLKKIDIMSDKKAEFLKSLLTKYNVKIYATT